MATMILAPLDRYFQNLQPCLVPRVPTGHDGPNLHLHSLINDAFVHQNYIGWEQYLRGRLSLHWKLTKFVNHMTSTILTYGCRRPSMQYGKCFSRFCTLGMENCMEKDYEEHRAIAPLTTKKEVARIYAKARHFVKVFESAMLHFRPLEQVSQVDPG